MLRTQCFKKFDHVYVYKLCLLIMTYLRIFNESSTISDLSYTCIFARQGFVQKQSLNTFIYQGTVSLRHILIFRNWFFVDHDTPRFYQNLSCSMFIIIFFFRFSDLGNIMYTSINLNCGFMFTIFFKMQVLTCLQGIWLYTVSSNYVGTRVKVTFS